MSKHTTRTLTTRSVAATLALAAVLGSPTVAHAASVADELGSPWQAGGAVARTAGRLFFTVDGERRTCSANVVASTNGDVIMTAAHCAFGSDYEFVPGYHHGAAPFGRWRVEHVFAPEVPALDADFAAMTLEEHDGTSVQDVVGGSAVAFTGTVTSERIAAFGYPRERTNAPDRPYGGEQLVHSEGPRIDAVLGRVGVASDMGSGVSGGPLFADFDPSTGEGVQVAAVSGSPCALPGDDGGCDEAALETQGVAFDDRARALYDRAARA